MSKSENRAVLSDYYMSVGDLVEDRVVNPNTIGQRVGIVLRIDSAWTVNATYLVQWNGWVDPIPYKDWEIRKVVKK